LNALPVLLRRGTGKRQSAICSLPISDSSLRPQIVTVHAWGNTRAPGRGRAALVASTRAGCSRSQEKCENLNPSLTQQTCSGIMPAKVEHKFYFELCKTPTAARGVSSEVKGGEKWLSQVRICGTILACRPVARYRFHRGWASTA
jgi:hypothetical protein